jgi:hypothetical protein
MNKYLEKIAAGSLLGNIARSVVGVAGEGVKAVGKQLSHATGGAYVDYAVSKGITSPHLLAKVTKSKRDFAQVLRKSPEFKNSVHKIHPLDDAKTKAFKQAKNKEYFKEHARKTYGLKGDYSKLQEQTRRARIKSVAIGGGAIYGVNKYKERADNINSRSSNQYAY